MNGKSTNGQTVVRCPGNECSDFRRAAGNSWEEKAENACTNCNKCNGNFPLNPELEQPIEVIDEIFERIYWLVNEHQAGCLFDLRNADYFTGYLFVTWITTEKEIARTHRLQLEALLGAR